MNATYFSISLLIFLVVELCYKITSCSPSGARSNLLRTLRINHSETNYSNDLRVENSVRLANLVYHFRKANNYTRNHSLESVQDVSHEEEEGADDAFEDDDSLSLSSIIVCIVYTISTVSAIFSNLILILVYCLGHSTKTELSGYLINLAIADFLMSTVCMPFTFAQIMLQNWIFGEVMCTIGI